MECAEKIRAQLGDACPTLLLVTGAEVSELDGHRLAIMDAVYQKPLRIDVVKSIIQQLVNKT